MNKKYIIISGKGGSGKSTFCNLCSKYERCEEISIVDYVKAVARMCGWDGGKSDNDRKFLSDLKDLLENYNDSPFINTILKANVRVENIIFINAREEKDRERFKSYFGKNAFTLLIKNPKTETKVYNNHADSSSEEGHFDFIVKNYGTIEDLEKEAKRIIMEIKKLDN